MLLLCNGSLHFEVCTNRTMTDKATLAEILGGQSLIDWFGYVPNFHDAEVLSIDLRSKGLSILRIHTWRMTEEVDDRGFFVLDRYVVVTVTLNVVRYVALSDFNLPGIIHYLEITKTEVGTEYTGAETGTQLTWTGNYGIEGTLKARQVRFDLQPGKP